MRRTARERDHKRTVRLWRDTLVGTKLGLDRGDALLHLSRANLRQEERGELGGLLVRRCEHAHEGCLWRDHLRVRLDRYGLLGAAYGEGAQQEKGKQDRR